ncbi:tetratricopeptide repeat protein [Flavobacterium sp. Sd200]|nr:tetratricopeptide repeat protein [Flavobacterium sp. Sd200]
MAQQNTKAQGAIIEEYATNCAQKHPLYSNEWQECLDAGLKKDSTIAYLWQQKAMPLFKQRKYELGMSFIDRAVQYDRNEYQDYRAFIKCIFSKQYQEAINDFTDCKNRYGNRFVMDHNYDFYISLCLLQLNRFAEAEILLKQYVNDMSKKGEEWVHATALFYYGVAVMEQKRYDEAIGIFDRALKNYAEFSDVKYYKAMCYFYSGKKDEASDWYKQAQADFKNGYTINEDNVVYETYPYQVLWGK